MSLIIMNLIVNSKCLNPAFHSLANSFLYYIKSWGGNSGRLISSKKKDSIPWAGGSVRSTYKESCQKCSEQIDIRCVFS